ncbi:MULTISPECIES: Shedu immune nuclease family protein [Sphingomonas]|jgi:hypothetical protein|uniref:Shedu immune nuclease family protein n=1 Tax=Sphingomonas TaxID=13687 RepID=UPI000620F74E|nr:Shedu immune nuclease family protein [Sphingomonas sp. Ag1]KKI19739.1 hypothetical protein XM50_07765 [Sphingomonas sp. Ag1]
MRQPPDEALASAFEQLLADDGKNENDIQTFLEQHTELLDTSSWLLNHRLHMNCVIAKFPIAGRTADFAYLTKSSDRWILVLIEIERPNKPLFTTSSKHVGGSSAFNEALAQTAVWRDYWEQHQSEVRERLLPLLVPSPMARNRIELRRVLIIGRSTGKDFNQAQRDRIASIEDDQKIKILTYDSLLRSYRSGWGEKKCVLSPRSTGYAIKHLDGLPKLLFAYVLPEHLSVPASVETRLKAEGYQMSAWRNNQLLRFNEKWASEPTDEEAGDVHPAVLSVIRAADRARPSKAKRR